MKQKINFFISYQRQSREIGSEWVRISCTADLDPFFAASVLGLDWKKEIVYSDISISRKEAIAIIEKQFKQLFARLTWLPYGWMDWLINFAWLKPLKSFRKNFKRFFRAWERLEADIDFQTFNTVARRSWKIKVLISLMESQLVACLSSSY